jgi:hypothetical protein
MIKKQSTTNNQPRMNSVRLADKDPVLKDSDSDSVTPKLIKNERGLQF